MKSALTTAATSVPSTHPRSRGRETDKPRPDGLDWQAFSARYFPDRRRHDFEVVIAYGAYKTARGDKEVSCAGSKTGSKAVQVWEEEGGAFLRGRRRKATE
jgi:hypothetical protein